MRRDKAVIAGCAEAIFKLVALRIVCWWCCALLLILTSCSRPSGGASLPTSAESLSLYLWEDFIPEDVIHEFERQTGVTVKADYFAQLDTLVDQMQRESARYDIVSPSDYVLKQLADESLLSPLGGLSNVVAARLSECWRRPWYDPELKYAAPLQWSLSGLAFNRKHVTNPPRRWADVFDPKRASEWAGRMALLDDARETLGIALLAKELDPTSVKKDDLESAARLVQGVQGYLARFDSEKFEDGLVTGALWVVHGWNGDIARAQARNPDVVYLIPQEGGVLAVDNLAIPRGAKNRRAAERFIEFMTRPEIAQRTTSVQGFASCVAIDPSRRTMRSLPEDTVLSLPPPNKTFSFHAPGEGEAERGRVWKSIRDF
jgi:spermidine/putrescine transport system substrate-binding protein